MPDAEGLSQGLSDAIGFLGGIGLDVGSEIQIRVVAQLPRSDTPIEQVSNENSAEEGARTVWEKV
jgi:hypothetical protein